MSIQSSVHHQRERFTSNMYGKWVLAFVLITHLVFALPDLMMLGYAVVGLGLWFQHQKASSLGPLEWPRSANFWVPFGFAWVFSAKLLSGFWAQMPSDAVNNAFNHVHFLLWPALIPFFLKADIRVAGSPPLRGQLSGGQLFCC